LRPGHPRHPHRRAEPTEKLVGRGLSAIARRGGILAEAQGVDGEAVFRAIKGHQAIDEENAEVRETEVVDAAETDLFDPLGELIAQVADGAADEGSGTQGAGRRRRPQRAQHIERIGVENRAPRFETGAHRAPTIELDARSASAQHEVGIGARERMPPEAVRRQAVAPGRWNTLGSPEARKLPQPGRGFERRRRAESGAQAPTEPLCAAHAPFGIGLPWAA
jgi:hypothetical protein